MKRVFIFILSMICTLSLSFALFSCGGNSSDTSSDTGSDTSSDVNRDTNTDTSSDVITDTSTDTSSDTDVDTGSDTSSDTDTDTDSDTDTDTDTDTDSDTDSDTDTDTDTDTDSDTDTDTDSDTDTDTDTDTDSDTDTDTGSTDEPDPKPDPEPEPDVPAVDPELQAKVDELLYSKHKLTYNDDGSFRVLILADLHMSVGGNATDVQEIKDRVKLLVDREQPNLVIFTGDNTIGSSNEQQLRNNIDAMVSYIEEKKIPWCHVYGNHDHEGGLSNEAQQPIYESYEYCISKDTSKEISGTGNYVHAVYNKDGAIGAVIYCLDSGAYDRVNGGYDYIKADQIAWYKETSEILQEYNGGKVINGMMAFHIALIENNKAHDNRLNTDIVYEFSGEKNEAICSSKTDTELLETIFERGDIKAIVTGHDHVNDYMYNYLGVKLTNSPNISDLTYYDASVQGGRVFDLNAATVGTNIPTYVSYVIERLNPDKFDTLENDVTLEFTREQIEGATITNWNGGGFSGSASVILSENKGVNGSDAIEVTRSNKDNFEFSIDLTNKGKLGGNKYLIVWADFSNVEFRKACFGLISHDGHSAPYRTDDADYKTPFYYLADGEDEWQELSHGTDGCFGVGDSGSQGINGKKGYFAFPLEYFLCGGTAIKEDSLVAGFYFYGSMDNKEQYFNVPFYFDDIKLVVDYKTINQ